MATHYQVEMNFMRKKITPWYARRLHPLFLMFVIGLGILLLSNLPAYAQMGGGNMIGTQGGWSRMSPVVGSTTVDWEEIVAHTKEEEQEGKEVWNRLQKAQLTCGDLTEDDFGILGEYAMGQMLGASHVSMNAMMIQMHGEDGEEAIHVALGKRFSGCDVSNTTLGVMGGWMPMMMDGWSSPPVFNSQQSNNSMMGYGFPLVGGFGWILMVLFWGLVIWGIISLVQGNVRNGSGRGMSEKSALDILKERYAKGEITKEEFMTMKQELGE